jgi:hypothetical protein
MSDVTLFDSREEARRHKVLVAKYLHMFCDVLVQRAGVHDDSKWMPEEYELRDKYIPELRATEYGSKEYDEVLKKLRKAADHHHRWNSHHPEHYKRGVNGMTLFDVVEMFCDWCAVMDMKGEPIHTLRGAERFQFDPQLRDIFQNTESAAEAVRQAPEEYRNE